MNRMLNQPFCKFLLSLSFWIFLLTNSHSSIAQINNDSIMLDTNSWVERKRLLHEIIVSSSKISEKRMQTSLSIDQIDFSSNIKTSALTAFDQIENMKGVHSISPSLGFKVMNARGFSNTTNVRFVQLVDGIDMQSPHIGAPIGNALGMHDLDFDKVELLSGSAWALYGMNATNGLVNVKTKNPFDYQGLSVQQFLGVNHVGENNDLSPSFFNQTGFRFAQSYKNKIAFKVLGTVTSGMDWLADNINDLGSNLNSSTSLFGEENPAYDGVNSYGNESPNRRTLYLNGKNYVVSRTGYKEKEVSNFNILNFKGDLVFSYRPKSGHELTLSGKGALINTLYQRSNRFRLENYKLFQTSMYYLAPFWEWKSYFTNENTGASYNLRSLAENMDRSFRSDDQWFNVYSEGYLNAVNNGNTVAYSHEIARVLADDGRLIPGSKAFENKKAELTSINNWDYGAALKVKSSLIHNEGLIHWDKLYAGLFKYLGIKLHTGIDQRTYLVIPDGNYFINPVDSFSNLYYSKVGGFTSIIKHFQKPNLIASATIRVDKTNFFDVKFNPRFSLVYVPTKKISIRSSYQSGYRFPSIFEGFSNIKSGGVQRIGGLQIMSNGIFENAYLKSSIESFQSQVNNDVNSLGLSQNQAIVKNKNLLVKNTYTYLQPEFIQTFEFGVRSLSCRKRLFVDLDLFGSVYDNFIAQVEANIPKTLIQDSIAYYLFDKSLQNRYRLWTNSKSKIYCYGLNLSLKYQFSETIYGNGNVSYLRFQKTEMNDGLEDGFNTPKWMVNASLTMDELWKSLGISVTGRYQSKYEYMSFLVNGEVPSFWTIDINANYYFKNSNVIMKIGANNLLNRGYYTILGGPKIGGMYYISMVYQGK